MSAYSKYGPAPLSRATIFANHIVLISTQPGRLQTSGYVKACEVDYPTIMAMPGSSVGQSADLEQLQREYRVMEINRRVSLVHHLVATGSVEGVVPTHVHSLANKA